MHHGLTGTRALRISLFRCPASYSEIVGSDTVHGVLPMGWIRTKLHGPFLLLALCWSKQNQSVLSIFFRFSTKDFLYGFLKSGSVSIHKIIHDLLPGVARLHLYLKYWTYYIRLSTALSIGGISNTIRSFHSFRGLLEWLKGVQSSRQGVKKQCIGHPVPYKAAPQLSVK